jgi:hypothetical protein
MPPDEPSGGRQRGSESRNRPESRVRRDVDDQRPRDGGCDRIMTAFATDECRQRSPVRAVWAAATAIRANRKLHSDGDGPVGRRDHQYLGPQLFLAAVTFFITA